jgi:4'-phosphopantetheinyl transferase
VSPAQVMKAAGAEFEGVTYLAHDLPGGVELWVVELDRCASGASTEGLQADELARARAYRFDRDRSRYLAGRKALRRLLAAELGIASAEVRLTTNAFGKPRLASSAWGLQFNVSHSGHLALIALSPCAPVGVDIELVRRVVDSAALAESHFTPEERQVFHESPAALRDRKFLQGWTRKEACLKACGVGLTVDVRHVHTGCDAGCRKVSLPIGDRIVEMTLWTLTLDRFADTIMSVACLTADARVSADLWPTTP